MGLANPRFRRGGILILVDLAIRPGCSRDYAAVVAIQDGSAELSAWTPEALRCVLEGRSDYGLLVAETGDLVIAFVMWRELPADEIEILSIAVDQPFRRRGAAKALLREVLGRRPGECHLEVRESNLAAQSLYRAFGFEECGLRRRYYHRPVENAVVMKRPERSAGGATEPR